MSLYTVEYRVPDYSIADAVHPDPMRGRRVFTIRSEQLSTDDPAQIEKAAIATAPKGYLFHSLTKDGH